jgi:hypothetical protein
VFGLLKRSVNNTSFFLRPCRVSKYFRTVVLNIFIQHSAVLSLTSVKRFKKLNSDIITEFVSDYGVVCYCFDLTYTRCLFLGIGAGPRLYCKGCTVLGEDFVEQTDSSIVYTIEFISFFVHWT